MLERVPSGSPGPYGNALADAISKSGA